jgi:hypothetical protein
MLAVTCANKDKGREVTAVCRVGCIGCGSCARTSDFFSIQDNLSTINYDHYTPVCSLDVLEACRKCKRKRLIFVGRPTDEEKEKASILETADLVEPDFKTTVDDMEWRG